MNQLVEFLDTIRTAHVSLLPALAAKLTAECGAAQPELLVEVDDPRVYRGLFRFDAVGTGPQFRELEIEPVEGLPVGVSYENDDLTSIFTPFSWNACRVQVRVPDGKWRAALDAWHDRWIDVADARVPDAAGLSDVIHALLDVEYRDGVLSFFADFGSASFDALGELGVAMRGAGADLIGYGDGMQFRKGE